MKRFGYLVVCCCTLILLASSAQAKGRGSACLADSPEMTQHSVASVRYTPASYMNNATVAYDDESENAVPNTGSSRSFQGGGVNPIVGAFASEALGRARGYLPF